MKSLPLQEISLLTCTSYTTPTSMLAGKNTLIPPLVSDSDNSPDTSDNELSTPLSSRPSSPTCSRVVTRLRRPGVDVIHSLDKEELEVDSDGYLQPYTGPDYHSSLVKALSRYAEDLTGRVEKIGKHPVISGGFSNVYHGRSLRHNSKLVAIKEIRLSGQEARVLRVSLCIFPHSDHV